MDSRLVLGCGAVGRRLAVDLAERPGRLLVVTEDEHRVETLRAEGIAAERADPTDSGVVETLDCAPTTVVVGSDDPERNRAAAELARDLFGDVFLFAYAGREPTDDDVAALRSSADRVMDPRNAIAGFLTERVSDAGLRTRRLRHVIRNIDGPLAVVAHDNPDPDAIASAVALKHIAERTGTEAEACYYGDISHQENRALVNLLEFDLRNLDRDADLDEFGGFALVDHSRAGVNDQLPPETDVDIVIDHHPPRAPVEARFVDLRSDVGATSTLLQGYLQQLGIEPDEAVATGLLFGIRVDTKDFSREVSTADFEAAAKLVERADMAALDRIESPSIGPETFEIIARAIQNREVHEGVLLSSVGEISDRDALAQAADQLLDMENITTTFVYGWMEGTVFASARARGTDLDLGEALREAFGQIGSAGGHADMAGAQIPVGALVEEGEAPEEAIEEVITDRFFDTLGVGPNYAAAAVYATEDFLGTRPDRSGYSEREDGGASE